MLPFPAILLGSLLAATAPALVPATADTVFQEVRKPGASVTVVNVWATWCQPCREEFPDLLKLRRAYARQGLRLVLVNADFGDGFMMVMDWAPDGALSMRVISQWGASDRPESPHYNDQSEMFSRYQWRTVSGLAPNQGRPGRTR